jgi:hypothetical protein
MGSVEALLKDELCRADRALGSVAPMLGHVLASSGHALINDAIVARVRGMLNHLALQLAQAMDRALGSSGFDYEPTEELAEQLAGDQAILSFCHAIAMEGHLTERLGQRSSVDPVLSPMWQELIGAPDGGVAELAMNGLAAQARFVEAQRRMQLPIGELPPAILERSVKLWTLACPAELGPAIGSAITAIKRDYDEGTSRAGLLARLISSMRGRASAALELDHAGLALFASALAALTGQPRERAVMACHEGQAARLAVSLRAAGLGSEAIERQFLLLEPAQLLPGGLEAMSSESAARLLRQSRLEAAG